MPRGSGVAWEGAGWWVSVAMGFAFLSSEVEKPMLLLVGGFYLEYMEEKEKKGDKNRRKKKIIKKNLWDS